MGLEILQGPDRGPIKCAIYHDGSLVIRGKSIGLLGLKKGDSVQFGVDDSRNLYLLVHTDPRDSNSYPVCASGSNLYIRAQSLFIGRNYPFKEKRVRFYLFPGNWSQTHNAYVMKPVITEKRGCKK